MPTVAAEVAEQTDYEVIAGWDREFVMGTYARQPVVFVRGEGARLWDSEGREYLDFLAGIAVCGLGHAHPKVAAAIAEQAHTLMHASNLYHNPLQAKLAKKLSSLTGMEKAFFSNSGAEANECAIKIARKWGKEHRGPDSYEIITFHGSFHGRTLATVTATANPKYQEPFRPMPEGFRYVPVGELPAITDKTVAIMIEPIQGESGINVIPPDFLRALRALCNESGLLLILDEVQSGNGRTGTFLASQQAGIQGDIATLAKGIANGIPMGVCLANGDAANTLVPGDHGSTFGGQPLACAAALATLEALVEEELMNNAATVGRHFLAGLNSLVADVPARLKSARGVGLMCALDFVNPEAKAIQKSLLESGIVVNATSDHTLRFLPPLSVTERDCNRVVRELASIASI